MALGSWGSAHLGCHVVAGECHANVMRDVVRNYSKHFSKMRFSLIFGSLGVHRRVTGESQESRRRVTGESQEKNSKHFSKIRFSLIFWVSGVWAGSAHLVSSEVIREVISENAKSHPRSSGKSSENMRNILQK